MEKHDRIQLAAQRPLKGGNLLVLGLWMRSAIALIPGMWARLSRG